MKMFKKMFETLFSTVAEKGMDSAMAYTLRLAQSSEVTAPQRIFIVLTYRMLASIRDHAYLGSEDTARALYVAAHAVIEAKESLKEYDDTDFFKGVQMGSAGLVTSRFLLKDLVLKYPNLAHVKVPPYYQVFMDVKDTLPINLTA